MWQALAEKLFRLRHRTFFICQGFNVRDKAVPALLMITAKDENS